MKLLFLLFITTIASAQTVYYPCKDTALLQKIARNEKCADSIDSAISKRKPYKVDSGFVVKLPTRDTTRVILQISDTSTRRLKYCCRPDGSTFDTTMQVNSFVQWLNGYEIRDRNRHYIYQHVSWLDERKQVLPDKYFVWVSWMIIP